MWASRLSGAAQVVTSLRGIGSSATVAERTPSASTVLGSRMTAWAALQARQWRLRERGPVELVLNCLPLGVGCSGLPTTGQERPCQAPRGNAELTLSNKRMKLTRRREKGSGAW